MKKFIIAILLMFTITGAYSQNAFVQKRNTESAPVFSVKFTDIDSTRATDIYFSDWFDISAIQGQTMYLTDSLYSSASTVADSVLIIVQGRSLIAGTQYVTINCDTLIVPSNTVLSTALTPSAFAPEVRFRVGNYAVTSTPGNANALNKVLWLSLTANTTNYLRSHKTYGNLP